MALRLRTIGRGAAVYASTRERLSLNSPDGLDDDDGGPHRLTGLDLPSDLLPRAFRDPDAIARRRSLLATQPGHIAPLMHYLDDLRQQQPTWQVPDFDPASGGVDARALFLFEKPRPMTADANGSGFISVHNDDPTAEATHEFALGRNRLPLGWCLFANVIPWWDGTRKISREQRQLSANAFPALLQLLPKLRAIVLVGGTAQRAWEKSGLEPPQESQTMALRSPQPTRSRQPPVARNVRFRGER